MVLEDQPQCCARLGATGRSCVEHATGVSGGQTREDMDQAGLARAGRAGDAKHVAAPDAEREVADKHGVGVAYGHCLDDEAGRLNHSPASSALSCRARRTIPPVVEMDGQKRSARVEGEDLRGQLDRPGAADDREALRAPALSGYCSVLDGQRAGKRLGDGRVMGDDDDRGAAQLTRVAQRRDHHVPGVRIELARRLVGQQHARRCRQRSGDRRPVLLSGRESVHGPVGELGQTHPLHQLLARPAQRPAAPTCPARGEADVLDDRGIGQQVAHAGPGAAARARWRAVG